MEQEFQLREVFNSQVVKQLAKNIKKTYPEFKEQEFSKNINSKIDALNYGERSKLITENLAKYLPEEFPKAAEILVNALEPELITSEISGFKGFIIMPQCNFISKYGMQHYDISMNALYEMTKRFTAENDIRPFIINHTDKTLSILHQWAHDDNLHVRRLVSEGTRPRLPLSGRIPAFQKDPSPIFELLKKLIFDPELYVRRSVANNLNDVAKDNPDAVVEFLKPYNKKASKETKWLIQHALRTLVKQGHKGALELLGYKANPNIQIDKFTFQKPKIKMGEKIEFHFNLISKEKKNFDLMLDYAIHFMKANGKQKPKVFKLSKKTVRHNEKLSFEKSFSFKPLTTRKYYTGKHSIEIFANGKSLNSFDFEVID